MNLPQNGRVVVIDDKPDEALPLIEALSKQNIPLNYFNPTSENLPDEPLSGVRVIFLDINLQEYQGHADDKTKASTAAGFVKKIIGTVKSPYLLLIWAKHDDSEILNYLLDYLKFNPPLLMKSLQKSECKEADYSLELILHKITTEVDDGSFFHILTMWENLVHQSAAETIGNISNDSDDVIQDWNIKLGSLFYALAEANAGINVEEMDNIGVIKNSILPFNSIFIDVLENNLHVYNNTNITEKIDFCTCKRKLSDDLKAEINSKLLLNQINEYCLPMPGNIYEVETSDEIFNLDVNDILNSSYLQTSKLLDEIKYIILEVSPLCDYSNKKWKVHRVALGFLLPQEHIKSIKKADYIYVSSLLNCRIDGIKKNYKLILDLRYFTSVSFDYLKSKVPLYRAKHQFLIDIQQKISTHISRPGVLSLN